MTFGPFSVLHPLPDDYEESDPEFVGEPPDFDPRDD